MTTSNAVADKTVDKLGTEKTGVEKAHEKLSEKRRALGRGLESLLPGPRAVVATPPLAQNTGKDGALAAAMASRSGSATSATLDSMQASADGEHAFSLDLDRIDQNPYQTRTDFDPKGLNDLAGSIQVQGVLQPIVVRPSVRPGVRPDGKERFILILGERRFRASKIAGKATIPAIVKRVSEQQAAEMTLVENLQRQDLDCIDQALAFAKLSTEFKLTQEEIGKRVGVSREQVSNYLRLLKLPPEVLTAVRSKELTYSHARLLLALGDDAQITKVARMVIAKKMSVALLQEIVIDSQIPENIPEDRREGGARWVDPNVRAEQRSLEALLGLRVRIRDRKGKGRITIDYGSIEEFDKVVTMLKGN